MLLGMQGLFCFFWQALYLSLSLALSIPVCRELSGECVVHWMDAGA